MVSRWGWRGVGALLVLGWASSLLAAPLTLRWDYPQGTAVATFRLTRQSGLCPLRQVPVMQASFVAVDSEERIGENGAGMHAVDSSPSTLWHTEWYSRSPGHPHWLTLDLGAVYRIDEVRYLPRQDGGMNGTIKDYAVLVSTDQVTWQTVHAGTFPVQMIEQRVTFPPQPGRYVQVQARSEVNGWPWTSAAEIRASGTPVLQNGALVANVPGTQRSVVVEAPSLPYCWEVTAVDAQGRMSGPSNTLQTGALVVAPPTDLRIGP